MIKKLKTTILVVILTICVIFLGILVYSVIPKECKHHFCDKNIYNPTCDEKGYTVYACKSCEYVFEADFVAPLGHNFFDNVVSPTCDKEGYTLHTCSLCNRVEKDTILPALGHDYEQSIIAPTCELQGCTVNACKNCDFVTRTDYVKPLGHDKEKTVVSPTCENEGYTVSSCKNCDYEYINDYVKPLGHSYSVISTVASTCTKGGSSTYECANCEHQYVSDHTDPLGHRYSKISTVASTCTQGGSSTYECSLCEHQYVSDYTDPLGHSMEKTSTVSPTCTTEGYSSYKCENCDHEHNDDYVAALGHKYTEIGTLNPTCTERGNSTYMCLNCEDEYVANYTAPKGHTLSSYVTKPTCTKEGYTAYKCDDCDYQYVSDKVPPIEHVFEKTYVRPNIAQTGYTIYECIVCGSRHEADFVFYSDIFTGAAGTGEGSLAFGLDLSKWSKEVDFEALKAAGVDFVILRVGAYTNKDPYFEEYYAAAREAGLDIGVYFFTYAESEEDSVADAKRVVSWLDGKTFEYPVFYDIEDDPNEGYYPSEFSKELITSMAHAFMTEMVDYGYYPGLYTNNHFLYSVFNEEKTLRLYDIWFANYPSNSETLEDHIENDILEFSKTYSMWQYDGDVLGYNNGAVEGMCDLNFAFKDYPTIIKKFGFNGYDN